jgi:uncharacterized SAM-binding protein YcdF (DUF218 family)
MAVIHHLFDPVVGAILLLIGALVAWHFRRMALARGLVIATTLFLVAVFALPVGAMMAKPLEDAYPRSAKPLTHVDGIVMLSGGVRVGIEADRNGAVSDNMTGPRMMAAADLARRFPHARLIFSGTSGGSAERQALEFQLVEHSFRALGLPPGRAIYERRSRDTWENLVFSKEIARPKPGETWVLVTSAMHMPRSMAIARRIGWRMVPWPSDYETAADLDDQPLGFASDNLLTMTLALHEWVGLATYWVQGLLG